MNIFLLNTAKAARPFELTNTTALLQNNSTWRTFTVFRNFSFTGQRQV